VARGPERLLLEISAPMNSSDHQCSIDHNILDPNLPPHTECTKTEGENRVVYYTVFWDNRVACLIQKDGPVTIMDYRERPARNTLYENMDAARTQLSQIVREITASESRIYYENSEK
jgi:hypothetical protein